MNSSASTVFSNTLIYQSLCLPEIKQEQAAACSLIKSDYRQFALSSEQLCWFKSNMLSSLKPHHLHTIKSCDVLPSVGIYSHSKVNHMRLQEEMEWWIFVAEMQETAASVNTPGTNLACS